VYLSKNLTNHPGYQRLRAQKQAPRRSRKTDDH
jgi:hypothetical protein